MKKEASSVRTVVLMMIFTLLSKALGLLRSVLMASCFGTGVKATAFSAASRIPLSFFDLLFSAAILGCFIPIYNSFGEDEKKADAFASDFFNLVSLLCGLLAFLGILFAPFLISVIAPELTGETYEKAVTLLRILFPMILFAAGAYTLVGVMQSKGRYLLPASISAFSNALIVVYLLFFNRLIGENDIYFLAAVYLVAWLLQLLTLLIPLVRSGFRFSFRTNFRNPALGRSLRMTPPIMIGSWLLPAGWLIATYFNAQSDITVFEYANTAYQMLAGILTYSICNYVFPKLSRLADGKNLNDMLDTSLSSAFLLILPFLAAVLVLGDEIIAILYQRNAFTAEAAGMTSPVLRLLCLAMPSFAVNEILSRAFYSRKKTLCPMLAAVIGVLVNIAVCLFTKESLGVTGVALGAMLGQTASALWLFFAALSGRMLGKGLLFPSCLALLSALLAFGGMTAVRMLVGGNAFERGMIRNLGVSLAVFLPGMLLYGLLPLAAFLLKKRKPTDSH